MFDYHRLFDKYCMDEQLEIKLSFDMPAGYETANGTFDAAKRTVFVNAELLSDTPDYEKAFFLPKLRVCL